MLRLLNLVRVAVLCLLLSCGADPGGGGLPKAGGGNGSGGGSATGFGFEGGDSGEDGSTGQGSGQTAVGNTGGGEDTVVNQWTDPDNGCGYGTIYGLICSKDEQMYVNGASVWVEAEDCEGTLTLRETISDNNGYYTLQGVPNGLQTVHVEKADWSKSYNVQVNDGMLSDVTGVGHKECFQVVKPCPSGSIWGHVCHEDGSPLEAGTKVSAQGPDCDGNLIEIEAFTDADGNYLFTNVDVGSWKVSVSNAGAVLSYDITVEEGKTTNVAELGLELCLDDSQCFEGLENLSVESKYISGMADIVIFIDTSGSMKQEAKWVQDNVNSFAQYIGAQAIDYHVVLIAKGYDICVPPPLGSGDCNNPNTDKLFHVFDKVGSNDGLEKIIENYPKYKHFLRKGATTNFIAVTDDNSDESASWFKDKAAQTNDPGFSNPFVFHSIVAFGEIPFVGCLGGAMGGVEYLKLTDETGGAKFPVCDTDWSKIFGEMAETIVDSVQSACGYEIDGEKAKNAETYLLNYVKGASSTPVPEVAGPDACGGGTGWYFDNKDDPKTLLLCPATCDTLAGGVLQMSYGCDDK